MVPVKAILAYLLYALLTAVLFLYLLFPDQAVMAFIDSRLAAIDPSLSMEAETVRPAIPPGLKLTGVDLNRDNVRLFRFDDARVSPDLMALLQDKQQARFQARLADGSLDGLAIMEKEDGSGHLRVEADLSQIQLDQLAPIQTNPRFNLSGSLKGRLTHAAGSIPAGSMTNGTLTAAPLHITLKEPFFGIADLIMDQADAEFSINRQNLRLKTLTFNGPMLEGSITGTIELRHPLEQSRLNLTGNAKPRPEMFARLQDSIPQGIVNTRTLGTRGLTFRIGGSLDNPEVSMR